MFSSIVAGSVIGGYEVQKELNKIRREHGLPPASYSKPVQRTERDEDNSEYSLGLGILAGYIVGSI